MSREAILSAPQKLSARSFFLLIMAFDLVAILLALILGNPPDRFFDEGHVMTWVSVFHLFAVSRLAWKIYVQRGGTKQTLKEWRSSRYIWFLITAGFAYLACDELLLIHENIDGLIHWLFGINETALTDRLDDLIIAAYGLMGICALIYYHKELLKYRGAIPFIVIGFLFFTLTVGMDIVTNREDILIERYHFSELAYHWFSGLEEGLKIMSEGVFLGLCYKCYEIARSIQK